jgi:hypothetical protein
LSWTDAGSSPIPDLRHRVLLPLAVALIAGAFVLLTGYSAWSLSLALLLPLLVRSGTLESPPALLALVIAGTAAATGGGDAGAVLVGVSSLLALAGSDSRGHRLLLLLPPVALVLTGSWNLVPLLISAAAAALLPRPSLRWTMITLGAIACLAIHGLPGDDRDALPITARCTTDGNGAVWPDTIALDHSQPVLLLDFSPVAGMEVELHASTGGVRRWEPVGCLELPGETTYVILPGDTTLVFRAPDGNARLVMSDDWRPFQHPILRFCGAAVVGGSP